MPRWWHQMKTYDWKCWKEYEYKLHKKSSSDSEIDNLKIEKGHI